MNAKLFITVSIAALTLVSPADAKRERGESDETAAERIESLQNRLLDEGLSDVRRERIEQQIESIADKFDIVLPPPPPPPPDPEPEPVVLFRDAFERGGGTALGGNWEGLPGSEISNGTLHLRNGAGQSTRAQGFVEFTGDYESYEFSYSATEGIDRPASELTVSYAADGSDFIPLATHHESVAGASFIIPDQDYEVLAWRFETTGSQASDWSIDSVTVTGIPAPVTTEFQGF